MRWPDARPPENPRRFRFHRCLGRGGFGEVYRATMWREGGVSTEVAVKVLSNDLALDSDAVLRLKDEGRLLGALSHPGIVKVYDLVILAGRLALVTEFIEGEDLHHVLHGYPGKRASKPPPFPMRALVETVGHVAEALHAAYTSPSPTGEGPMGLVHRDVKPQNIRLSIHGGVKLLDFGIARARNVDREAKTQEHLLMGSWPYLPPERLGEEGELGPECDVYALGCTLYEGLAGERLMEGRKLFDLYDMLETDGGFESVVEPSIDKLRGKVPKGLVHLLGLMLATDPGDRPAPDDVTDRCEDLAESIPGANLKRWARERSWPNQGSAAEIETDGPLTNQDLMEGTLDVPKPTRKGSEPPSPVRSIVPAMVVQTPTEDIEMPESGWQDTRRTEMGASGRRSDSILRGRPVTPPPPPPFPGVGDRSLPRAVAPKPQGESTDDDPTVTREDTPAWDEEEEPTQGHGDADAVQSAMGVLVEEESPQVSVVDRSSPAHRGSLPPRGRTERTPFERTPPTSRSDGSSFRALPVDRSLGISLPSKGDRQEPALPELLAIDIDDEPRTPSGSGARAGLFGALGVGMALVGLALMVTIGAIAIAGGLYWYSASQVATVPPPVPLPVPAQPEPAQPVLTQPEPAPVEPAQPAPAQPAPAQPAPAQPAPAQPAPAQPEPEPAQPAPVQPGPRRVVVVEPEPAQPAPAQPAPAQPAPAQPAPAQPAPAQPAPVEPAQPEPAPAQPTAGSPATLIVEGDALVELQGDFGGFRAGTPLPPGGYAVWADFGAGLVDTGVRTIALPSGKVYANCSKTRGECIVTP